MSDPEHRLAELLGALSLSTDSANGVPPETALRTAVVAVRLARRCELELETVHDAYYAAVLRFLGCTAYAHETASRYAAGDDRAFLRAVMTSDPARPIDLLRRAHRGLSGARSSARFGALWRLSTDRAPARTFARAHCDLATALAARIGGSSGVTRALGEVYERFDGRGFPEGRAAEAISPAARVVILAVRVVSHALLEGPEAALEVVAARRGSELDPSFAAAFLADPAPILQGIGRGSVWEPYLDAEPSPRRIVRDDDAMPVAEAFAHYADMKCPYTLGHSHGVAALADRAAQALGLDAAARHTLRQAALLHDLGRVAVANGIWDKPGPLTSVERARVETHAAHTARFLERVTLFRQAAAVAGSAHERTDGSGYPTAGTTPTVATRILAASDMFHALGEARPHRPAHSRDDAVSILASEARGGRLDPRVVDAVLAVAGVRSERSVFPDGLTPREIEVLEWLARGLSNKEIAARLAISPKTVQHHVAHIYEKTGVKTRPEAAVYAVRTRLFE